MNVRQWVRFLFHTDGSPDNARCQHCRHLERYHFGDTCYAAVGPLGSDCGNCRTNNPQTLSEPSSALSDEQEFTPEWAHIAGGEVLRSTQWHAICQVHDSSWRAPWLGSKCEHPDHRQEFTK